MRYNKLAILVVIITLSLFAVLELVIIPGFTDNDYSRTFTKGFYYVDAGNGKRLDFNYYRGYDIKQTTDGGYIVTSTGYFNSLRTEMGTLLKLDASGNATWVKSFNGTSIYAVRQTSDGGYIAAGSSLIKTDASGNPQWHGNYGFNLFSVIETDDGYVSSGYNMPYAYIQKVDKTGNIIWQTTVMDSPLVGVHDWRPGALYATSDGGYAAVYERYNQTDKWANAFLIKFSSTGAVQWKAAYEHSNGVYSCLQTDDCGYVIAGTEGFDALLIKTDAKGNLQWRKNYGYNDGNHGYGLIRDPDGGFVVSGGSGGYAFIFKTDANGNQRWMHRYDPTEYSDFTSITRTADNCYAMTGHGSKGILVMKITGKGNAKPYENNPLPLIVIDFKK